MEIIYPMTPVQKLIQEQQEKAIFDDLEVGSIVQYIEYKSGKSFMGFVLEKEHDRPVVCLLLTGDDKAYADPWKCRIVPLNVIKFYFVSPVVLKDMRRILEIWYERSKDNLTYIEILIRLNEYEKRFS